MKRTLEEKIIIYGVGLLVVTVLFCGTSLGVRSYYEPKNPDPSGVYGVATYQYNKGYEAGYSDAKAGRDRAPKVDYVKDRDKSKGD